MWCDRCSSRPVGGLEGTKQRNYEKNPSKTFAKDKSVFVPLAWAARGTSPGVGYPVGARG
ncbi:protein of unknown function [Streptantibioticus cattleyicolor NRRL 8057 = DSM 46488]|nr:protein of unknown function [Streptantibioticus cattleyicolor NRRL 8057 = DSM 46488]